MHANRGMYAEELFNRTIDYLNGSDCLIEKRNIPIKIVKDLSNNLIMGKLLSKSTVDYCGYINHKHIEFEVKQTNQPNFDINMIKPHQYQYLTKAEQVGSVAFVVVHFSLFDEFYLLPIKWIDNYMKSRQKKMIKYEIIKTQCQPLTIVYPGIINLTDVI